MEYPRTSPYYLAQVVNNQYLDVMFNRTVPKNGSDVYWIIQPTYNLRPDLLALDLYGDGRLWWIFAQRNPDILLDPLFDFVTGIGIYIPTQDTINTVLGL